MALLYLQMPTSVPNFNFLARLVSEIWTRRGLKIKIGATDFPRRPLADKFLHSEYNGTSAQKGYLLPFKIYTMERI